MDKLETSISIAVNGQNMTTEHQGAGLNAGGVAAVQNQVRLDKRKEDAKIALALRAQCLTWWAKWNYNDPDLAPRPEYQVEPPEDELAEASSLKMLGDALQSLQTAQVPVDVRTVGQEWAIPMLTEEEVAAKEAQEAEEAAERFEQQQQIAAATPQLPGDEGEGNEAGDGVPEGEPSPHEKTRAIGRAALQPSDAATARAQDVRRPADRRREREGLAALLVRRRRRHAARLDGDAARLRLHRGPHGRGRRRSRRLPRTRRERARRPHRAPASRWQRLQALRRR